MYTICVGEPYFYCLSVWQSIERLEKHIEMMQDPHPRAFFHDRTADGADTFKAHQRESFRDLRRDVYITQQKAM